MKKFTRKEILKFMGLAGIVSIGGNVFNQLYAKNMKNELVKNCGLTEEEAVELINICPKTMSELRSFTFGWKKLILSETLEKILKIIKDNS